MTDDSSLLVEKLWRLKRKVAKGECPGMEFVHLNNLLRDPDYRKNVLRRVSAQGSEELKQLVSEIRQQDRGESLMTSGSSGSRERTQHSPQTNGEDDSDSPSYQKLAWLLPFGFIAIALTLYSFTAPERKIIRVVDNLTSDTRWESDKTYILEKDIFVENARLTIEPGTIIKGKFDSALIVTQTGQLFARGRRDKPIIFTSARPEGKRARGDWGGVVVLGSAPVNEPDANIEGVATDDPRGSFGGQDPEHHCGVIEYTRIEFAGYEVFRNNELNGLTLGGCGDRTIVRNVQVHHSLDDGVEVFGGTVNLKNILITGPGDDGIDWDWGWTGHVQFALIQQHPDAGDNAFEGDSNKQDHQAQPRSEPHFYNITLVSTGQSSVRHRGMVLRTGSGGHFHNMVIDSYGLGLMDTRDDVSSLVDQGRLSFSHNLIAEIPFFEEEGQEDNDFGFDEKAWAYQPGHENVVQTEKAMDTQGRDPLNPYFRTKVPLSDLKGTEPPRQEFFDQSANYKGALNPKTQEQWFEDWSAFPES